MSNYLTETEARDFGKRVACRTDLEHLAAAIGSPYLWFLRDVAEKEIASRDKKPTVVKIHTHGWKKIACSFCGKASPAAGPLIASHDHYLCAECAKLASEFFDHEKMDGRVSA